MKQIVFTKAAAKDLRLIPQPFAKNILAKIEQYAADPASLTNMVSKLQGRPGFRLRVGDYRVIFSEDGIVITILRVGSRGGVYE